MSVSQKRTKSGNEYLYFRLRDASGETQGKWFSPTLAARELENAALVQISGRVDDHESFRGELKIDALVPIFEIPADLTPFQTPLPQNHKAHLSRFQDLIRSIQNPHLKALLRELFAPESEIWKQFQHAPAAKSMHHNYRGGLLEHSGEVATMCDRICATMAHLNRDLLVCAALLHDIGKLEEMRADLCAGEYTPAGHLVGHIVLGACTVSCLADTLPNFPVCLKHELMHLILSHHGRTEWGAAKTPMCAEAVILSSCDLMSAKIAQIRGAASKEGDEFSSLYGWHERETNGMAYVGAMRRAIEETQS